MGRVAKFLLGLESSPSPDSDDVHKDTPSSNSSVSKTASSTEASTGGDTAGSDDTPGVLPQSPRDSTRIAEISEGEGNDKTDNRPSDIDQSKSWSAANSSSGVLSRTNNTHEKETEGEPVKMKSRANQEVKNSPSLSSSSGNSSPPSTRAISGTAIENELESSNGYEDFQQSLSDSIKQCHMDEWKLSFEQFVGALQLEPTLCQFFAEQNAMDLSGSSVDPVLNPYTRTIMATSP